MERCSTSLIGEIQIKNTKRYHLSLTSMADIKRTEKDAAPLLRAKRGSNPNAASMDP